MLLLRYAQSEVSETEAIHVESHMLDCATCFRDLKILDRARRLVAALLRLGGDATTTGDVSPPSPRTASTPARPPRAIERGERPRSTPKR
jgi:anti-sigma factor RsiW